MANAVILFDGVCNLCNGAVNFIIDRDPKARFTFAPLQSVPGQALLKEKIPEAKNLDSIILVNRNEVKIKSDAALSIAYRLSGLWPALIVFKIIPRFLRDHVYDWIARNRYRFFGKRNQCRMPNPELKSRFLAYEKPTV